MNPFYDFLFHTIRMKHVFAMLVRLEEMRGKVDVWKQHNVKIISAQRSFFLQGCYNHVMEV